MLGFSRWGAILGLYAANQVRLRQVTRQEWAGPNPLSAPKPVLAASLPTASPAAELLRHRAAAAPDANDAEVAAEGPSRQQDAAHWTTSIALLSSCLSSSVWPIGVATAEQISS